MRFAAVFFDLGGVVLTSPFDAFAAHERERGLAPGFLRGVVHGGGEDGAWARLERGELPIDEFALAFEAECAAQGGEISVRDLMTAVSANSGPRPAMVTAIHRIRAAGLRTGAITNNWVGPGDGTDRIGTGLPGLFDAVIESATTGLRKPDPRIYRLACERLGVEPSASVFLDDLGVNLKPARALGMATIKVIDPADALRELEALLGIELGEAGPVWTSS